MSASAQTQSTADLPVHTGVPKEARRKLAKEMGQALATCYVLYHKIHAYHWNVTGPHFYAVHNLTDKHYKDIAEAIDAIAERIRAIGFPTPVGLSGYLKDSKVPETASLVPAEKMIEELAEGHQTLAKQLRAIVLHADAADDVYTHDLLTSRIGAHEKAAWMLNALLVKE